MNEQQLRDFATNVAGAVSFPFMRDNPSYVMPSEELIEIVGRCVAEFLEAAGLHDMHSLSGQWRAKHARIPRNHAGLRPLRSVITTGSTTHAQAQHHPHIPYLALRLGSNPISL